MRREYECAFCGKTILRYPSQVKGKSAVYCSRKCLASARPKIKHEHLSEYNREHNAERMTPETRAKLRAARVDTGEGKGYRKLYGIPEHRVVAEQLLGRPLRRGEVVHHIDGNKRNNAPENLMIFPSQAEHVKYHAEHPKGGDAT